MGQTISRRASLTSASPTTSANDTLATYVWVIRGRGLGGHLLGLRNVRKLSLCFGDGLLEWLGWVVGLVGYKPAGVAGEEGALDGLAQVWGDLEGG